MDSNLLEEIKSGKKVAVDKEQLNIILEQNHEMKAELQVLIDFVANLYSYFFTKGPKGEPKINFDKLGPLIAQVAMPKMPKFGFGKKEDEKEEDISAHPVYIALKIDTIEPLYQKYYTAEVKPLNEASND